MPENLATLCPVCGKPKRPGELIALELVRPSIATLIRREHPDLPPEALICLADLNRYRVNYIEDVLETEKGELSQIESDVIASIRDNELLSADVNEVFEERRTLGQRLADGLAAFGGSWIFIGAFLAVMLAWIILNTWKAGASFDPYPFILLNLVLSCLAAIQAPIIMMSQNRQEAKDRLHAEHDYRVNLKAEIEIRYIHEKLDHLMMRQWQRLLEIQQMQMQLMREMVDEKDDDGRGKIS